MQDELGHESLVYCHMLQGDLGAAYPSRGSNIEVQMLGQSRTVA